MLIPDVPLADLTKLETAGMTPETAARIRGRMFRWYVRMGHRLEFKEGKWNSHGDLRLMHMPTLRDFKRETTSVFAIVAATRGYDNGTQA